MTGIDRREPLTRFQFYLGLTDALNSKQHADSGHLRELATSFAHDVLNLAALAGRLLWYEGVTPEIWRSHDLIAVSVDTEPYYVMLQSACDIMADVIATLGTKKGQAPWESFHKLNEWALKNPHRLDPAYRLVARKLPWFGKINSTRTGILHRGQKILVYTDRVTFNWGRLLPTFRELTRGMLSFSERLSKVVTPSEDRNRNPQKTVLDGVYVPALRHLLDEYTVPKNTPELKVKAQCLVACGGYVEAAYIGYPRDFWWEVLVSCCQEMPSQVIAANIPVNARGTVHDAKFVFSAGKTRYGMVSCDQGKAERGWIRGALESARRLQSEYSARRVVFVVREMQGAVASHLPGNKIPLIVGRSAPDVTSKLLRAMMK